MILSLWAFCAIAAAIVGARKGEAGLAFLLGALLGPLGVLIALASSGNRTKCPFCCESVHKEAAVCPHCQREF